MDEQRIRQKIIVFVSKEARTVTCVCGRRTMESGKIYFNDKFSTEVDVICKDCGESRIVTFDYPEEIIDLIL